MFGDFSLFKSDHYHRVSAGPFEPRPAGLAFSDMVLHLPVLEYFASLCDHVTEFGVRDGASTAALIAGCKGEVVSYDIEDVPVATRLRQMVLPCRKWSFHRRDTLDPTLSIASTDLLLFDTLHTGVHLSEELRLHAKAVRRFFVFHDTFTCAQHDVSGPNPAAPGILPVVRRFQREQNLKLVYETQACNGLIVLERT